MSYFIVVQHRRDRSQPWANTWTDDDRLDAIETTPAIVQRCETAKKKGERVFVHRNAWVGGQASVCCSVEVAETGGDDKIGFVKFKSQKVIGAPPRVQPPRGHYGYEAPPPR